MNPILPVKAPKKPIAEKLDQFEEGNHCMTKREHRPSSGESCDRRYISTERSYPECDDIELSHCFNYGNWKYMKSKSNKSLRGNSVTVWKCGDCG